MHSLFRVGKKGAKYDFEISDVEAMHAAIEGKLVSLRWARGSKGGSTQKNVVATPDGRAIWPTADAVGLGVTLYRSDTAGAFDAKDFKVAVDEVVRAGATKTLASAKIDLAKFADKAGAARRAECELTLVGDDGQKGRIKLTIASAPEGSLVPRSRAGQVAKPQAVDTVSRKAARRGQGAAEQRTSVSGDAARRTRNARGKASGAKQKSQMAAWERRALGLSTDRCTWSKLLQTQSLPSDQLVHA